MASISSNAHSASKLAALLGALRTSTGKHWTAMQELFPKTPADPLVGVNDELLTRSRSRCCVPGSEYQRNGQRWRTRVRFARSPRRVAHRSSL